MIHAICAPSGNEQPLFQIKKPEQLSGDALNRLEQATWSFKPNHKLGTRVHNPPPFLFCTPYTRLRTELTKTNAFRGHSKLACFVETFNKGITQEKNSQVRLPSKDILAIRKWQCGLILNRALHKLKHKQLSNPIVMQTLKRAQFFCATEYDIQQIKKWINSDLAEELKPHLKDDMQKCFLLMTGNNKTSSHYAKLTKTSFATKAASQNFTTKRQNQKIYDEAKSRKNDIRDYTGVNINLEEIIFTSKNYNLPRNIFAKITHQDIDKDIELGAIAVNTKGKNEVSKALSADYVDSLNNTTNSTDGIIITGGYWNGRFQHTHVEPQKSKELVSEYLLHELTHSAQTALQASTLGRYSTMLMSNMTPSSKQQTTKYKSSVLITGRDYFLEGEATNVQCSTMSTGLLKHRNSSPLTLLQSLKARLRRTTQKQRRNNYLLAAREMTKYEVGASRVRRLRNLSETAFQTIQENASLQALMFLDKALAMLITRPGSDALINNDSLNTLEKNQEETNRIRACLKGQKMKIALQQPKGSTDEVTDTLKKVCPLLKAANLEIITSHNGTPYISWEFTEAVIDEAANNANELHSNLDLNDKNNLDKLYRFYYGELMEEITP